MRISTPPIRFGYAYINKASFHSQAPGTDTSSADELIRSYQYALNAEAGSIRDLEMFGVHLSVFADSNGRIHTGIIDSGQVDPGTDMDENASRDIISNQPPLGENMFVSGFFGSPNEVVITTLRKAWIYAKAKAQKNCVLNQLISQKQGLQSEKYVLN